MVVSLAAISLTLEFIITISSWSLFFSFSFIFYKENEYLNAWLVSTSVAMGMVFIYSIAMSRIDYAHLLPFIVGICILLQKKMFNLPSAIIFNSLFLLWANAPFYFPFNWLLLTSFSISEAYLVFLWIKRKSVLQRELRRTPNKCLPCEDYG